MVLNSFISFSNPSSHLRSTSLVHFSRKNLGQSQTSIPCNKAHPPSIHRRPTSCMTNSRFSYITTTTRLVLVGSQNNPSPGSSCYDYEQACRVVQPIRDLMETMHPARARYQNEFDVRTRTSGFFLSQQQDLQGVF